ncbi:ABCC9, partial [Symbiodinium sp. KB8]
AGEKIGICGRTGAGKSSFISALFRLADVQEGTITIDGVDINQLHLRELRSRLAIIPQEPTLFSGTLLQNLDPFNQYSDQEIMNILDHVALGEAVRKAEGGLETHVSEGGENWSTGQRQLICMARALLRRCKIVVLDEATAGCDVETDAILQVMPLFLVEFKDCTVLTIAHRLHTIIDSDRILVLERGRVAEFDSPSNLLNTPDSLFKRLLHESATARGGDDNTATHESVEAKP